MVIIGLVIMSCNSLVVLSLNIIILHLFGVSSARLNYRWKSICHRDLNMTTVSDTADLCKFHFYFVAQISHIT